MTAERLTAADIYDRIERLERVFAQGDDLMEVVRDGRLRLVSTVDLRLTQLIAAVIHVRDPHHSDAMELVDELKRARISRGVDLSEGLRKAPRGHFCLGRRSTHPKTSRVTLVATWALTDTGHCLDDNPVTKPVTPSYWSWKSPDSLKKEENPPCGESGSNLEQVHRGRSGSSGDGRLREPDRHLPVLDPHAIRSRDAYCGASASSGSPRGKRTPG